MKKFKVGEPFRPKEGETYIAILHDGRRVPVVAVHDDINMCNPCPLYDEYDCFRSCDGTLRYRQLEDVLL